MRVVYHTNMSKELDLASWLADQATNGRPRVVVEIGPGAAGVIVNPEVKRSFEVGDYSGTCYAAIDPDPSVNIMRGFGDYVRPVQATVQKVAEDILSFADETWMCNPDPRSGLNSLIEAAAEITKPGGQIYIHDHYEPPTSGTHEEILQTAGILGLVELEQIPAQHPVSVVMDRRNRGRPSTINLLFKKP